MKAEACDFHFMSLLSLCIHLCVYHVRHACAIVRPAERERERERDNYYSACAGPLIQWL